MRARVREFVLDTPVLDSLYNAVSPQLREQRVAPGVVLVLDGFPRSGNTYARVAFDHANPEGHRVSSHLHVARAIHRAVELGIPAVVVVRDPAEVLASALQYDPTASALQVLRGYQRYYRGVMPLRASVVVAPFTRVVSDFGSVIDECNARFGTSFNRYEATPEAEAAVRTTIEAAAELLVPDRAEQVVGRPSSNRRSGSHVLEALSAHEQAELEEARRLFERFVGRS
ncbi:hypothetical protein GCM10011584_32680 [Nocardioides phosphati]|uniref:Uncharacterized protein n=1 Tax=Nocardioides phosphati TaxID=1867775 RepID=A0ABQ2ND95_9ACTN|nr:hypothetical protein [Nocardioides phosphati]GGO93600.1 hypothetical protein GCM10011584_32680 [Nocardioides phosphati]